MLPVYASAHLSFRSIDQSGSDPIRSARTIGMHVVGVNPAFRFAESVHSAPELGFNLAAILNYQRNFVGLHH